MCHGYLRISRVAHVRPVPQLIVGHPAVVLREALPGTVRGNCLTLGSDPKRKSKASGLLAFL